MHPQGGGVPTIWTCADGGGGEGGPILSNFVRTSLMYRPLADVVFFSIFVFNMNAITLICSHVFIYYFHVIVCPDSFSFMI